MGRGSAHMCGVIVSYPPVAGQQADLASRSSNDAVRCSRGLVRRLRIESHPHSARVGRGLLTSLYPRGRAVPTPARRIGFPHTPLAPRSHISSGTKLRAGRIEVG